MERWEKYQEECFLYVSYFFKIEKKIKINLLSSWLDMIETPPPKTKTNPTTNQKKPPNPNPQKPHNKPK